MSEGKTAGLMISKWFNVVRFRLINYNCLIIIWIIEKLLPGYGTIVLYGLYRGFPGWKRGQIKKEFGHTNVSYVLKKRVTRVPDWSISSSNLGSNWLDLTLSSLDKVNLNSRFDLKLTSVSQVSKIQKLLTTYRT